MLFKDALIEDIKTEYFHKYSLPDEYLERILLIDSANERVSAEDKFVEIAVNKPNDIKVYQYNNTINFMRAINTLPNKNLKSCHVICKDSSDDNIASFEIPVNSSPNIANAPANALDKIDDKDVSNPIILYRVVSGNGSHPLRHEFDILDMREELTLKEYYEDEEYHNPLGPIADIIFHGILKELKDKGKYTKGFNIVPLSCACMNIARTVNIDAHPSVHVKVCRPEEVAMLLDYNLEVFYAGCIFAEYKDDKINKTKPQTKEEIVFLLALQAFVLSGPVLFQFSKSGSAVEIRVTVVIIDK